MKGNFSRNIANTIDNDDDEVIVLTRYGLIVGGTKRRLQYKYFEEPIDGR